MAEPNAIAELIVIAVNAGSTGLRLDAFEASRASSSTPFNHIDTAHADTADARQSLLREWLQRFPQPRCMLHRIVHGGDFRAPQYLTESICSELARWTELAPLHNGPALELVEMCRQNGIEARRQIGIFDTALFADLPALASQYALPPLATPLPIRRYGFHGLAHQSMFRQWREISSQATNTSRVISLQLGGGCSLAARRGDTLIDSSMGFTPLEGVPMATRCGDTDPGLLLYLLRHGYSVDALDDLLNRHSGLAGVSGIGGDMRTLLSSTEPRAHAAIDLFCYRTRKAIGAYIAALGGVDAILFGGGIGEHAVAVRERILRDLDGLGIAIDLSRNAPVESFPAPIHADESRCEIWVVAVDEAQEMLAAAAPLITH